MPRLSLHQGSSADPMLLAQVCSKWREVALSTPLLWSSIHILCSDKGQRVPLLKAWLQRSAGCPLSIRFVESVVGSAAHDPTFEFPQSPFTEKVMSLLVAEKHRWQAIDFSFSRQISPVLSNIAVEPFPLLETASITSRQATDCNFGGVAPLEKIWQAIHSSPSFRGGKWEMEYLEQNLNNIPWGQITTMNVTMTLQSLFEILPRCNKLVQLHYTDPFSAYNTAALPSELRALAGKTSGKNIVVPALRDLSLKMDRPPAAILDQLTLPSLSSYNVQLYCDNVKRPHASSFVDLLIRSECCLESFTYDDPEDNAETAILEILSSSHMASLAELNIRPRTTDAIISLLKRTDAQQDTLPRLERLSLGPCSTASGVLSGMVLSRQSAVDEIASLRVFEVGRWDQHAVDLECFKGLLNEDVFIAA
ncbi:hypothetical protein H0H87_009990 [Tephrocybe sp. NHM501043]|nr:hypothetical protein H0H87_009990 [Tephrocybe sp. NHM501043]